MTFRFLLPAIVAGLLLVPAPASACPFCAPTGTTLTGEVAQADFILYGTLSNANRDANDPTSFNKGTTEMTIDLVIKSHDMIKDKKTITIPRYIPPDDKKSKYLIFFNIFNGQLDPYRGDPFPPDSKLPEYLKGAIGVRQKDTITRLRYFFDYLEDTDITISTDAYAEFGYADYNEVHKIAPKLPVETLTKWLKDPNTRGSRIGLYALLLGHCGKADDAKLIRAILDDPKRSYTSGLDGLVAGFTMLDHKAGWDYLIGLIKDPNKDFLVKYAALKTVRFFWEFRPDVIPQAQSLDAIKLLIDNPGIADMAIEDVRKWKQWDLTGLVLGYAKKESHNTVPINNRAILKFAIAASWADPKNAAAATFVAEERKKNAKQVDFMEEVLKDELKPAANPQAADKPTPPKPGS